MNHDGGRDGGEGGEERGELLGQLDYLEDVIQGMKQTIVSAGDNDALVASSLVAGNEHIRRTLAWLSFKAEPIADKIADDLFSLVAGDADEPLGDEVWTRFRQKLQLLNDEGVTDDIRKMCLCRREERGDGSSLIHKICYRNPPVDVAKALLEAIPEVGETEIKNNHLAVDYHGDYPIHNVLMKGGSIELVKLLVEADGYKETLGPKLFCMLVNNKEKYEPEAFSEILRHLIVSVDDESPLIQEVGGETAVVKLLGVLEYDGLSKEEVLNDDDFAFLLKATFSHFTQSEESSNADDQITQIEQVPLHHAFMVCSSCFDKSFVAWGLGYLFSLDTDFLLKPDVNGDFLLHRVFRSHSYFISGVSNNMWPSDYDHRIKMVKMILRLAPQCAQLIGEDGRSMLHIAADNTELGQGSHWVSDSDRLDLVRAAWEAYPDAAKIVDKTTGLPPFALASREEEGQDRKRRRNQWDEEVHSISSAFFLLREAPEVLSNYI